MPFVNFDKAKLYYEIHGQGKPLVLIAGLSCDITFWQSILNEFKSHFQLLIIDNRGVGRSECPMSFSIQDMANDVIHLLQEVGIKKPHILGHSMGGCVVQTLAHQHREMFDKLIISNSLIKMNQVTALFENFILGLWQEGCSISRLAEGVMPWIFSSFYLSDKKNVEEFINNQVNHPYPQSLIGFQNQLNAVLAFDSHAWYNQIKGPALIIGSDEDILCPRDSELLAHYIEDAKYVEFHHVGHCPLIEKPKDFAGLVINYLKGKESI